MPKFRNTSGDSLNLGHPEGPTVGPSEHTEAEGSVKELDDAYLVGPSKVLPLYGRDDLDEEQQAALDEAHGSLRLYPKATWSLVHPPKKTTDSGSES